MLPNRQSSWLIWTITRAVKINYFMDDYTHLNKKSVNSKILSVVCMTIIAKLLIIDKIHQRG
jgi:hypothetical protein